MVTSKTYTGNEGTITINENNTLNLLQKFVTHLTLYVPSQTAFDTIYVKSAVGEIHIATQDLHRKKLLIHGGINKINVDIQDVDSGSTIEMQ